MGLKEALQKHFDTKLQRSPEAVEREKWLIPGILPFHRIMLFPAAVIIQLCCGSLYAWSGYNLPIETAIFGPNKLVDRAIAVNTFYIAVAVFGCTAAILGPWLERSGPFRGAMLGATLFYLGNLITAAGVHWQQISVVYIGYGLFGGAGLGIAYISPVSPLQKWFPEIRGLAAGFAVCGFGGGSIIAPYTQKALIGSDYAKLGDPGKNLGVPLCFLILGSVYFTLMSLSAFVLRMPPPGYEVKGITIETIKGAEKEVTSPRDAVAAAAAAAALPASTTTQTLVDGADVKDKEQLEWATAITVEDKTTTAPTNAQLFSMTLWDSLTSLEYGLMYPMFLGAQLTGLLIISKIQQITVTQMGRSTDEGALINSLLGGANLLGRLMLPFVSDLTKSRKGMYMLSTAVQAVLLGVLPTTIWTKTYPAFLFCVNLIAFFYGAGFGIIPAFLADQFGSKNVGATHGVILTAWAIGGVCGGLTFTAVYNSELSKAKAAAVVDTRYPNVYDVNFRWILAMVIVAFFLSLLIPTNLRDRRLPLVEGEKSRLLRFRFGSRGKMWRFVNGRFVSVSREEEEREWNAYMDELAKGHGDKK
ncbi:hypothetical protein HDU96_010411 [Phlyctochytrium bullatum]|nr:hypothetical protein HDU96_010411 [Phlyctochytrium bullatum]